MFTNSVNIASFFVTNSQLQWLNPVHQSWQSLENGYIESFINKLRDECLNRDVFRNWKEAQTIVEVWSQAYNDYRPHSSLGYLTPVKFARGYHENNQTEGKLLKESTGTVLL